MSLILKTHMSVDFELILHIYKQTLMKFRFFSDMGRYVCYEI